MYASLGEPMKASANRRGENLAITIALCQRKWSVRRSHNTAVVMDIGRFGDEHGAACSELRRNTFEHILLYALNKNWDSPPAHLYRLYGIPSGPGADSFFLWPSFHQISVDQFATVYHLEPLERTAR